MDFIAATNLRSLALEHKEGVSLALDENAFSALSHSLHSKVEGAIFPCGSVPKSGQWETAENVTLQKRPITIMILPFWRSHAVC